MRTSGHFTPSHGHPGSSGESSGQEGTKRVRYAFVLVLDALSPLPFPLSHPPLPLLASHHAFPSYLLCCAPTLARALVSYLLTATRLFPCS